jgi:hypothetical protein
MARKKKAHRKSTVRTKSRERRAPGTKSSSSSSQSHLIPISKKQSKIIPALFLFPTLGVLLDILFCLLSVLTSRYESERDFKLFLFLRCELHACWEFTGIIFTFFLTSKKPSKLNNFLIGGCRCALL